MLLQPGILFVLCLVYHWKRYFLPCLSFVHIYELLGLLNILAPMFTFLALGLNSEHHASVASACTELDAKLTAFGDEIICPVQPVEFEQPFQRLPLAIIDLQPLNFLRDVEKRICHL